MKKAVIGILAHVDAGKTTLAEAILYRTGIMRKLGRVDHGDTVMDTNSIERERGITIFSSQAQIKYDDIEIALLDTPGHVDFSAETERTLSVLDYAILVISGTDLVQSHTRTLWKLLELYHVPTFLFVTKMDFARFSREEMIASLKAELSENCIDFTELSDDSVKEQLAMCREDLLEKYLESGEVEDTAICEIIKSRLCFPCYFGSGLKLDGVDEFLGGLNTYVSENAYPDKFGAKVYKISHDAQGNRLTHMKITGGTLNVRDIVCDNEKVNQIRFYTGSKFATSDTASAGQVCAVTGLTKTKNGMGLGFENTAGEPVLEPVMRYRINIPSDVTPQVAIQKLKILEEEDPQLHITWNEHLQEINVGLMGKVQAEILKSLIFDRFSMDVTIDSGRVMYKETIENTVEGVGHYEPLRHYAEVHLILEPLSRGSGLVFDTKCSEDVLDRNWQRLILTHLYEKQHLGVLTGSPITDMKITLAAGRAHIKHTEGGDFRQSTYRAVRNGLMYAKSILLEPYYAFKIYLPPENLGRAINDIRLADGEFEIGEDAGGLSCIFGRAPVNALNDYASVLAAYTGGRGRITLDLDGYDLCKNPEKVIAEYNYDPEADLDNTPDSVFCAHGGGFPVKWNRIKEYMHLESCLETIREKPEVIRRNIHIDDKELEAIMEREFGPVKRPVYTPAKGEPVDNPEIYSAINRKKWFIVDGYNVIFAWDDLSALAEKDIDAARSALCDILSNYSSFTKYNVVLVFDAYKVQGGQGKRFEKGGISICYTKENETADMYIEKLVSQIGKNEQVRVVTSDGLIQLSAVRSGVLRVSAREFESEVEKVSGEIQNVLKRLHNRAKTSIGENIAAKGESHGN